MSHSPALAQSSQNRGAGVTSWLTNWRERRKQWAHRSRSRAALAQARKLMSIYPTAYMDESWLPASKHEVKSYLKSLLLATNDEKKRRRLKNSWLTLSNFQPGVGELPVDCTLGPASTAENIADLLGRYSQMSKVAEAEIRSSLEDIEALTTASRKRLLRLVA